MNKTYSFMAAVLMALAPAVLTTSCSSSDNDDDIVDVTSSKQRLEITISGDYSKFNYSLMFLAYSQDGKAADMKTSQGNTVSTYWDIVSTVTPFTYAYAEVDGKGKSIDGTVTFSNPSGNDGTVTVTARVSDGNKVIREQSRDIHITSDMDGASIVFSPESGFSNID